MAQVREVLRTHLVHLVWDRYSASPSKIDPVMLAKGKLLLGWWNSKLSVHISILSLLVFLLGSFLKLLRMGRKNP